MLLLARKKIMTIPSLNENGELEEGEYEATLDEMTLDEVEKTGI